MGTIDGSEACFCWQHGDMQIHVSAAVAYGIWHYVHVTGDREFLRSRGLEVLMQICRYYASRGAWSQVTRQFGFWMVMGPDEFHMGVNNNCYTNFMARKCFQYTLDVIGQMKKNALAALDKVRTKLKLTDAELTQWRRIARGMYVPLDKKTGIHEQHDGFFNTPHLDWKKLPADQFPLYHHWAYLRIFRWDMIKQPDVLLLPYFFSHEYSDKQKKANYEYYEPRCAHESSLSPAVHSILAAELGKHKQAIDYWTYACRLDLDDYNRNTHEGLHTTSMAATWMNIVFGFGGMRTDGEVLSFKPTLPRRWKAFTFRILYREALLEVGIDRKQARFKVRRGPDVDVDVFGKRHTVTADGLTVAMPRNRVP
jgi:maltose phosphorylase